jgi:hypothetical protein
MLLAKRSTTNLRALAAYERGRSLVRSGRLPGDLTAAQHSPLPVDASFEKLWSDPRFQELGRGPGNTAP